VIYALLADGRDEKQLIELDALLAPTPEAAETIRERANMDAMKALQAQMGGLAPPRRPR
jgi:hypothetical protein